MRKSIIAVLSSIVLLGAFVFSSVGSPIYAASNKKGNSIDLNNLEQLEKEGKVTVEEITYEEFVKDRAKAKGISVKEAKEMYKNPNETLKTSKTSTTKMGVQATSADYHMLEVNVKQVIDKAFSDYDFTVQAFIWAYSSGSFTDFQYIEEIGLDRDGLDGGTSKQFGGTVKGKLLDGTSFWWFVNGDFFDNGTTTISGGVGGEADGAIGKTVTANFNISFSYESNHYAYFNEDGEYSALPETS